MLQLNTANVSDTKAPFLDLQLPISNGFVSSRIYDKRDNFDRVYFPIFDDDVSQSISDWVHISQLIRYAVVSSHVNDFNAHKRILTVKLLQQDYRYQ